MGLISAHVRQWIYTSEDNDLDYEWESVAHLYQPGPYIKAFRLENLVEGICVLSGGRECYTLDRGGCSFLFDCWSAASYCGPEFVRKYKIKPKGGEDIHAGHQD